MSLQNTGSSPFLWGAATSSHQIEGYNKNDWSDWEAQGNIEGGTKSGAATDHWNRFREDIRLAAELGLNSYRFSIEWSRLEPDEGQWDASAFQWYKELILKCENYRLVPMLTLHHFTSPKWFAAKGGFAWKGAANKFNEYVKKAVHHFGAYVPLWCTFNEPMVLVIGTYLGKFMPPAQFAPHLAAEANHQLLRAHTLAYDTIHSEIIRREGHWKNYPIQVGIAHNMLDFLPDRFWHPIEHLLAKYFHRFYNRAWLDAITGRKQRFGALGIIPPSRTVTEALGRMTADFIGVNYYTKAHVQWRPRDLKQEGLKELPLGVSFAHRKDVVSDVGWAIHPQGFKKVLRFAASYGLPLYITENGIADREDCMRSSYIEAHIKEMALLIQKGMDIRGYYHWSLLDNFEWIKGFGPRFGLYRVNYDTFERSPTASAVYLKNLVQRHRSTGQFEDLLT